MAARKNKEAEEQTDQKEEQVSVEETLSEIEARIRILEKEDATLEEAFTAYREGMELIRRCDRSIGIIEERVSKIAEDGTLTDMEDAE
ncbi:MAG: exodeoxyribonuclease VII small subunit [Lachnospiraceae bacterium]|nr:exodeoxyribonuclease VII small subunit [Lachnospiraceae bacterium]